MSETKPHDKSDQIFWGLLFIAAGTILLLQRLGISDFEWTMRRFWPVIVIVIGAPKLFHSKTVWSALWIVAVGVWLQMVTLHISGFTYASSWPLLLILLGAGMIVRTIAGSARRGNAEQGDHHV
jgi:hypothetical protein